MSYEMTVDIRRRVGFKAFSQHSCRELRVKN
jgi:hypothetical protein